MPKIKLSHYNKAISQKIQVRHTNNIIIEPSSQLASNTPRVIQTMRPLQISFLNFLIRFYKRYGQVTLSYETMALHMGCAYITIRRMVAEFVRLGILAKFYRHMDTLIIDVSQLVLKPYILALIFRCLLFGSLMANCGPNDWYWRPLKPATDHDEQLINIKGLTKPNSINQSIVNLSSSEEIYERRIDGLRKELEELKQKEREELKSNPIPQYVKDVTELLQLTKWGQIWLTAFPEGAIEYAKMAMRGAHGIKSKYRFFSSKCNEYCKQNEIAPDWNKVNFLKVTYQMPENAAMSLEKVAESLPVSVTPKTGRTDASSEGYIREMAEKIKLVNQEDPYQAALKVERAFAVATHDFKINPWLEKLPAAQQEEIRMKVKAEFAPADTPKAEPVNPMPSLPAFKPHSLQGIMALEPKPSLLGKIESVKDNMEIWSDGTPMVYAESEETDDIY